MICVVFQVKQHREADLSFGAPCMIEPRPAKQWVSMVPPIGGCRQARVRFQPSSGGTGRGLPAFMADCSSLLRIRCYPRQITCVWGGGISNNLKGFCFRPSKLLLTWICWGNHPLQGGVKGVITPGFIFLSFYGFYHPQGLG